MLYSYHFFGGTPIFLTNTPSPFQLPSVRWTLKERSMARKVWSVDSSKVYLWIGSKDLLSLGVLLLGFSVVGWSATWDQESVGRRWMGLYEKARKIPLPFCKKLREVVVIFFWCIFAIFLVFNNNKNLVTCHFLGGEFVWERLLILEVLVLFKVFIGNTGNDSDKTFFFHSVVGISCGTVVSGK